MPEELREHPSLAKFKTPADLFKSYVELEQYIGKKKIPLPESDDDQEGWERVFKALGAPESPDQVEIPVDEDLEVDESLLEEFKKVAVESKLLPKQAQALAQWWLAKEKELLQAQERAMEEMAKEAERQLRKEWGQAYESKLLLAKRTVDLLGGPELMERLEETGLGNDPVVIKFLARIGEALSEDTLKGFKPGKYAMTPEKAREELEKLTRDPNGPYWDERHPDHRRVVERALELRRIANGG